VGFEDMKRPLISIIVPTYKEAKNIPVLVRQINKDMSAENILYEVIIIDDDSRDGIDAEVEKLKKRCPVRLDVRIGERGLSSAVIKGFAMARGEIIAVMDADLSHPPSKLPEMIQHIIEGKSEFVIGSRFVKGGSVSHFNWYRLLNAWISRTLARPLISVKDPMSGFFAFPRKLIRDISSLNPIGFKIGLELMVKFSPKNIVEIPINFEKRLYGESKLSLKEQMLYILHLLRLYSYHYVKPPKFARMLMIGFAALLVNLFFVYLAHGVLLLPYVWSLVIGFYCGLTSFFILDQLIAYNNENNGLAIYTYLSFLLICGAGLLFNLFISVSLYRHNNFFHQYYMLATLIGIISGMIVNYTGSRILTLKER
jgi:dolichol-phosphate mannosyltransferase